MFEIIKKKLCSRRKNFSRLCYFCSYYDLLHWFWRTICILWMKNETCWGHFCRWFFCIFKSSFVGAVFIEWRICIWRFYYLRIERMKGHWRKSDKICNDSIQRSIVLLIRWWEDSKLERKMCCVVGLVCATWIHAQQTQQHCTTRRYYLPPLLQLPLSAYCPPRCLLHLPTFPRLSG